MIEKATRYANRRENKNEVEHKWRWMIWTEQTSYRDIDAIGGGDGGNDGECGS